MNKTKSSKTPRCEQNVNARRLTYPHNSTIQDYFKGKDALLFCIDASESMLEPRETRVGEPKSHLQTVLDIAVQLQKRKVITSPNDLVGIMFFNTVSVVSLYSSGVLSF
jgi:hypothetical protein